jgi:hypothetical protein
MLSINRQNLKIIIFGRHIFGEFVLNEKIICRMNGMTQKYVTYFLIVLVSFSSLEREVSETSIHKKVFSKKLIAEVKS